MKTSQVDSRRPSLLVRWWLPLSLLAVIVVLGGAKLALRSAATGQPILPGVANAPVSLRVPVVDAVGQPVNQAVVEVRDRFNAAVGSQETGPTGDATLQIPPNPAYVITARKLGFGPGRIENVEVLSGPTPVPTLAAATPGLPAGPRPTPQLIEIRLGMAEGQSGAGALASAPGSIARLYIGHTSPRVTLVDASSQLLLKHSDPLGQGRQTLLAANKDLNRLFAAWSGGPDVFVLDGAELTLQRQTPLGSGGVTSIAVSPTTGHLWVSTSSSDGSEGGLLSEMDTAAQQVTRRMPAGSTVFSLRFRPDGAVLYVPQRSANSLALVDPDAGRVITTLRLSQWPSDYTFSADGQSLYMVNIGADKLVEIGASGGEQRRSLDVGTGANGVVAHPDGQRLYVLNQLLGYVQFVDLAAWQVVDLVPVGRAPQSMALAPDGRSLYVANAGSGSISIIDLDKHTTRETLTTGGNPSSLLLVRS